VGLSHWHDYLEIKHLKLSAEHFPLSCSLQKPVLERYTDLAVSATDEQAMKTEELTGYLRSMDDYALSPLKAVLAQTEAIGDPALPNIEQVAILHWVGAALHAWETLYPLDTALAAEVARLKPVVAALAVCDDQFLTPGAHPMHQLLDLIQHSAIGWQPRLGRAGQSLEKQINSAIDKAYQWFDDPATDITEIYNELLAVSERDQARASRMAQRVVETEQGKVKTANAKLHAAHMINAVLEKYSAPEAIGEFLKGPWYASAQLVLLKFGADSEAWQAMSATTETLMDSLQTQEELSEERRQHIFEVVTQVPKDLRRWLLNLHHDPEAVNDAVGLVEFAHLRVLRQQPLDLQPIEPIPVEGEQPPPADATPQSSILDSFDTGQWFSVDTGEESPVRVQLVLKMEAEQQLLFTNQAGIKVLQQDYDSFAALLHSEQAKPLQRGASFSYCLAGAADIETLEDLEAFTGAAEQARLQEQEAREQAEREAAERARLEQQEQERKEQEAAEAERKRQEALEAQRIEAERVAREKLEAEQRELEREEENRKTHDAGQSFLQQEDPDALALHQEGSDRPAGEIDEPESQGPVIEDEEPLDIDLDTQTMPQSDEITETTTLDSFDTAQESTLAAQAMRLADTGADEPENDDTTQADTAQEQQPDDNDTSALEPPAAPPTEAAPAGGETDSEATLRAEEIEEVAINLPMGAWLGFHDGDTPTMAKLAVHDREQDHYIFVNREGIKLRQLSRKELLKLMSDGLVDVLETNTRFREVVNKAIKE
tara:strand:+ start:61609 stop:63924 length:2316 start_codon:yes stop_codon:yes gene_type:complete